MRKSEMKKVDTFTSDDEEDRLGYHREVPGSAGDKDKIYDLIDYQVDSNN